MQNFRSWYVQLPARTRQIVVVALALAVLITIIAVFQGGEPPKREVYNKKNALLSKLNLCIRATSAQNACNLMFSPLFLKTSPC